MNSPFTELAEVSTPGFTFPVTERELNSPFIVAEATYIVPETEGELTAAQLTIAVDLNRKYMADLGWEKYAKQILQAIGITNDDWITNSRETNLESFTKFFADWQDRNKFATTLKGVFGLNNWTYFQKKIGLNNLGNSFNINVEKAVSANKTYEGDWGKSKSYIFGYLNKGLPLNDEYFAYMIAAFQNDINPSFNNQIKVDGILGKITWDILRSRIENSNPGFDLKQHIKTGDAKNAVERYFEARLKYSNLMIIALEKIQSDAESIIRNEPIEFNTTRETIYAVVNGIIGAVPIVGAAGNAMLDYNKAYWDNVKANLDKQFDNQRSLKLNDIIYILKNQSIESSSAIVVEHILKDKLNYSGSIREKIFSDFINEIERIMILNQSPDEIMKIALSSLIGALSPHTRIYIHCGNTTDFKDWDEQDISNLLNDSSRKRLNLRFTAVHPTISAKDNNLTPTAIKNLNTLWEVFKRNNYTFKDLGIKKDVFFSVNLPLSIDYVISNAKYTVEFSYYLKTILPGEGWSRITTVLNLPPNVYRLPDNKITYKDEYNSISRSLLDKNNKGLVYENIVLEIANSVMQNEYNLPSSPQKISLISNEMEAPINARAIYNEYGDLSNAEINVVGAEEMYPATNSEQDFTNETAPGSNTNFLSAIQNLRATKFNQSQLQKSGLLMPDIISSLTKFIDWNGIRQQLQLMNQSGQTYTIAGSAVIDSVFTEAVHQFQMANYLNPADQDGVIGQSTLETLGVVNHNLKSKLNSSGFYGQGQLNRSDVRSQIPVLTNNEFSSANWFQFILKPAWLGVKITDGIHIMLYRKLKEAEQWLLTQPQYKGMTSAALGKALGFNAGTRYSGARLSAGKQAMHGFGLALDINAGGNPWIGAGWIQNDTVLLQERYRMIKALRNASGNQSLPGNTIFEYLHTIAQSNGNDTRVAYNTLMQRNDEFITYLRNNSSEQDYWKNSQTFANRDPLNGFLNLHVDLVYALRQVAGLAWGAIDFGPRASGDIMHFDLRTLGVGKFLCEKIGGYVPKGGHPTIGNPGLSGEISYEINNQNEFTDGVQFHEAIGEAEWDDKENASLYAEPGRGNDEEETMTDNYEYHQNAGAEENSDLDSQYEYADDEVEQPGEDINTLAETEIHWWSRHRILQKGDTGKDVGKLQEKLRTRITNVYDDNTVRAVIKAQKARGLKQDGKVGPLTHAMLFHTDYKYSISKPPIVKQNSANAIFNQLYKDLFGRPYDEAAYTCWAACFESAIPSWKDRTKLTILQLLEKYKLFIKNRGDITFEGFSKVTNDFNGEEKRSRSEDFETETIKELLLKTKSHLLMVTQTPGYVAHTEVIYGVGLQGGDPYLLVMDPLAENYRKHFLININNTTGGTVIIVFPK